MKLINFAAAVAVVLLPVVASQLRRTAMLESLAVPEDYEGEIWNGSPASSGEFPAFALLCFSGSQVCGGCGGVLISTRHVLTAGHCVVGLSVTGVRIGAATSKTDGIYRSVSNVVTHPDYYIINSPLELVNDVAVLTLSSAVSGVTPLSYNRDSSYSSISGTALTAIGYGRYQAGTGDLPISTYLRKTTVFTLTNEVCQTAASALSAVFISTAMMCTYVADSGACRGDSGGPLIDNNNLVLGVLSWGATDCSFNSGDFWTDLWRYASWIDNQAGIGPTPSPTPSPTAPTCGFTIEGNSLWERTTTALKSTAQWIGFLGVGGNGSE